MQSVDEQTDFTLKRSFNSSEKKNSNVAKATIYAVFWESDLQTNVKVNFCFVATRQILLKDQLANEKRTLFCRKNDRSDPYYEKQGSNLRKKFTSGF